MKPVPMSLQGLVFPDKVVLFSPTFLITLQVDGKRSCAQSSTVEGITNNQRIPGKSNEIIVLVIEGREREEAGMTPHGRMLSICLNSDTWNSWNLVGNHKLTEVGFSVDLAFNNF